MYPEMVAVADSLTDLARRMQVDAAGLAATLARYNGIGDGGRDEDFGKPSVHTIAKAPFYAAKMALVKHTCRNGIRVNTRGQVLSRAGLARTNASRPAALDDQPVIPRLYAAGECAHYLGRYHGHGTLGIYSFYGRVAARRALAEKAAE
jgi:succinate dehydrogenase/fumarate reductase flavoprotein subunit